MNLGKNPKQRKIAIITFGVLIIFLFALITIGVNNSEHEYSKSNDNTSLSDNTDDDDDDFDIDGNTNDDDDDFDIDGNTNDDNSTTISSSSTQNSTISSSTEKIDDFSKVSKTYTLTSGNYEVGTDIPVGVANITAVSGKGNLMTDSGAINEMFGIDDGDGLYTGSYKNAELEDGDTLKLNSDLKVTLNYSKVESNIHPWTYNESAARQLGTGTYTAGIDFPAGIYKIVAVSGTGNLSDENDLNEIFGIDDGDKLYNSQFNGASLTDGDKLKIEGNLVVKLVPVNK